MKKVRLLLIINIVQVVLLIGSICAAVIFLPNIMNFEENKVPLTVVLGTDDDKHNGFAQVTSYGAVADDGKDDTAAFKKALATNASIYVPVGTYDLSETLVIDNKTLKGTGSKNTVIRSSAENIIVSLSGSAVVEDMSLCFADGCISNSEKSGDRVAIFDNGLTQGSMIRGVGFSNIGTGFLSSADSKGAFCTTLEAVTFNDFSYKAIEIVNGMSTVIRSATIGKGTNPNVIPVSLGGVATIEAMSFNVTECEYLLQFKRASSIFVRNITFNGVKASSEAMISCNSARFSMQVATLLDSSCKNLVDVNDGADVSFVTEGTVNMIYSDSDAVVSVSESDKIKNEINIK